MNHEQLCIIEGSQLRTQTQSVPSPTQHTHFCVFPLPHLPKAQILPPRSPSSATSLRIRAARQNANTLRTPRTQMYTCASARLRNRCASGAVGSPRMFAPVLRATLSTLPPLDG
ncbi:hypothetical protein C8R44DRAFT_429670 [Mycena epipterygia]|nr:hypothetical protein C8R44DRAFT_429670 [Mycena epipterygia]